jgi:hypothetical protein
MNQPWYDSRKGIEDSVLTLDGLNLLYKERHAAGYRRKEQLSDWLILGLFHLDRCGNFCRGMNSRLDKTLKASLESRGLDVPAVLTWDEATAVQRTLPKDDQHWSFNLMRPDLPPPLMVCPCCAKGWSVESLENVYVTDDQMKNIAIEAPHIGKTRAEVQALFNALHDAEYYIRTSIVNPRFIDLSPKYTPEECAKDEWMRDQVKNKQGYISEGDFKAICPDNDPDMYVYQAGDVAQFCVWTYYHKTCYRRKIAADTEAKFKQLFDKAGLDVLHMVNIQNEYWGDEIYATPWFIVQADTFKMKIGWRKRVISIEIMDPDKAIHLGLLFKDEDVTKEASLIHAWGYDKAEEYLRKINEHLRAS